MNGVKTIDDLRARCYVDEDFGCWHWRLCKCGGSPRVRITFNGKTEMMAGRRAAYVLAYGKAPKNGHRVFRAAHCKSSDCVNPEHTKAGSPTEEGAVVAKTGRIKNSPARVRANRTNARSRAKLTMEIAREIRASDEPHVVKARKYGVHVKTIYLIESGQYWKENTMTNADVFSWASQREAA